MINKTLKNLDLERMFFNAIEVIDDKLVANIILNGERLKAFLLRSEISTLVTSIQHSTGSSSQRN
jgi:hypothetical protein